jgi:hypothetical protein
LVPAFAFVDGMPLHVVFASVPAQTGLTLAVNQVRVE